MLKAPLILLLAVSCSAAIAAGPVALPQPGSAQRVDTLTLRADQQRHRSLHPDLAPAQQRRLEAQFRREQSRQEALQRRQYTDAIALEQRQRLREDGPDQAHWQELRFQREAASQRLDTRLTRPLGPR